MTNSIYEKMTLTQEHEKALKYATSKLYLKKVEVSKTKRAKRKSIRKKGLNQEINKALTAL